MSYNRNILVTRNLTKTKWVGKISKSLREKGVDFRDLNERAVLAFRLAGGVGLPILPYRIVLASRIHGLDLSRSPHRISDNVFLTRLYGQPLPQYLEHQPLTDIRNVADLYANIVFNVWIGNYDRKDEDYLVQDDQIRFIDYQLWGPGFGSDPNLALGAYTEGYGLAEVADTGWCVGGPRLIQHLRDRAVGLQVFKPALEAIDHLSPWHIRYAMRRLRLYDEHYQNMINREVVAYLVRRRTVVGSALDHWIRAGYPQGQRPKDKRKDDTIYRKP